MSNLVQELSGTAISKVDKLMWYKTLSEYVDKLEVQHLDDDIDNVFSKGCN